MLWAADCVEAQTGVDTLAAYRGRYSSAMGAAKALRQIGQVERTEELMANVWGPRHHISRAQMGDIVALQTNETLGLAAGVCYGRRSFFVGTDGQRDGLVALDTLSLEHCYKPCHSLSKQLRALSRASLA